MLPTLNAMSVMGLISIPGMVRCGYAAVPARPVTLMLTDRRQRTRHTHQMTGQILAGQDPQLASRYQLVLMFLVVASTGMATVLAVIITLLAIFDKNVRGASSGRG